MVQQTKDSTFTEYGLAHAESGLSNPDKQLSISIATKRTELLGSRNESPMAVSKSIGSQFPVETSESVGESVKISGTKRPIRSPPKINGGSGHIVYVRRKPELELAKSNLSDTQLNAANYPDTKKSVNQDDTTQQLTGKNEPVMCVSDAAPLPRASSPSFSSTRRSISPSLGVSSNISSPENIKHGDVNCIKPSPEDPKMASVNIWEEQYSHLQSLLKTLDQSDQYEYVQMLRSLSSVELSRHAVELEKRSIKLSLDEGGPACRGLIFKK
ncbi:uncharacterized protein LOC130989199 isoform X2 [Salvia miltiorrhiza]|uniref:uncharacterized protein LOC130989199 isoform X2 n=1 Tax=Salvia miltiorrhiza TaxID=226208 RepID=UPI0025AB9187|nr:uncharacterized protein LOC130989199 isoform X2 [Salvia miltiorrhiza]